MSRGGEVIEAYWSVTKDDELLYTAHGVTIGCDVATTPDILQGIVEQLVVNELEDIRRNPNPRQLRNMWSSLMGNGEPFAAQRAEARINNQLRDRYGIHKRVVLYAMREPSILDALTATG